MDDVGTDGEAAAQALLDSLDEPRRSQLRHLHEVIRAAAPELDVRMWDYSGPMIGYGTYRYHGSRGRTGEWFAVGLASRKAYVSLYSMGMRDGVSLVAAFRDRFPGAAAGRSCFNLTHPERVDDDAVRELVEQTREWYRTQV